MKKKNKDKALSLAFLIITITFLVGIIATTIVNYAIDQDLTWALYVIGGEIVLWVALLPIFKFKKNQIIYSILFFIILAIPYLFLVEYLTPAKDWVIPLALPIAILTVIYFIIVALLWIQTKFNIYNKIAITILFTIPVSIITNSLISNFLNEPFNELNQIVNIISIVCVSAIIFVIGYNKKTSK